MESNLLYEKLIFENLDKGFRIYLTVSEFRDVQYVHIRKYFLSYEGEWLPSKEGIAIPATISNTFALADGLIEICSFEESIESIEEHFENKLLDLRNNRQ